MVNSLPQQPKPRTKARPETKKIPDAKKFEYQVYTLISRYFPNAVQEVFVYINEYKIVEIDVVVVHSSGLYLFEAKFKKGKIFGHPNNTHWTAQHTERKSTKMYNPLRQTEAHVRLLAKKYNISPTSCHSIIVFTDLADISEIRYSTSQTTTCTYKDLPHILNQIKHNTNTPVSPFILDNIYHDLRIKSGVQKYRDLHKEVVINSKARRKPHAHRRR